MQGEVQAIILKPNAKRSVMKFTPAYIFSSYYLSDFFELVRQPRNLIFSTEVCSWIN